MPHRRFILSLFVRTLAAGPVQRAIVFPFIPTKVRVLQAAIKADANPANLHAIETNLIPNSTRGDIVYARGDGVFVPLNGQEFDINIPGSGTYTFRSFNVDAGQHVNARIIIVLLYTRED